MDLRKAEEEVRAAAGTIRETEAKAESWISRHASTALAVIVALVVVLVWSVL